MSFVRRLGPAMAAVLLAIAPVSAMADLYQFTFTDL